MTNHQSRVTSPDVVITEKGLGKMYPSPAERLKELLYPFGKKYHKDFRHPRRINGT